MGLEIFLLLNNRTMTSFSPVLGVLCFKAFSQVLWCLVRWDFKYQPVEWYRAIMALLFPFLIIFSSPLKTISFIKPYTTQSWLLTTLKNKLFENIVRKRENTGNQHFLLFLSMISTLLKANSNFSATFILLSASTFNLNHSESLWFGKEFNYF